MGRSYRLASLAQDKALADVPSGWSRGLPPLGAPGLEAACPVLELQRLPLQGRGWAGRPGTFQMEVHQDSWDAAAPYAGILEPWSEGEPGA